MITAKSFTKNITSLLFIFLLMSVAAFAQKTTQQILQQKQRIEQKPEVERVEMSAERGTPNMIQFKMNQSNYQMRDVRSLLKENLNLREGTDKLEFYRKMDHQDDIEFVRYQQYYKDIKVVHGQYVAMSKADKVVALNGEFYEINDLNTSPTLTEEQALQAALDHIGAEEYVWEYIDKNYNILVLAPEISNKIQAEIEEHTPKGELVIVDDYDTDPVDLDLAYKFNIYANQPISRDWVYVNAHTGKVMLKDMIIKHAHASVQTRYNGIKTIQTTEVPGQNPSPEYPLDQDYFILYDQTRGNGIQTYDMNGLGGAPISVAVLYSLATDVVDDDNIWTLGEHVRDPAPTTTEAVNDDIAWDAHWGAAMVYDYWKDRHGRKSFDDNDAKINSYVHYGEGYDNAFWNGSVMTYGDGSFRDLGNGQYTGSFAPLTSIDVCAHEIGHAVCSHTADLVYRRESGAMNEGFSDIWAACVEAYVTDTYSNETFDYKYWGIGEQVDNRQGPNNLNKALRWMDDPKLAGDPDTYGGSNWTNPECGEPTLANDYCGVHSNSGVLNKWFYLMTVGSGISPDDGVNDKGDSYSVTGIGFAKAELIAFGTEVLLGPNSKFAEARAASITYARSVYGPCSVEEEAVTNAWFGVGIGDEFTCESGSISTGFLTIEETVNEAADGNGFCDDSKTHDIDIFVNAPVSFNLTVGGTATQGTDYTLSSQSISYTGNGFSTIKVTISIIDDAAEEGDETIVLTIPASAGAAPGSDVYTLTIRDDDVNPVIGIGQKSLLFERFLTTSMPAGWGQVAALSSGNQWHFGSYAGKAYISFTGVAPNYEGNNNMTDLTLHTPQIDARGMNQVTVSFDWEAGGETDIAIGGAAPFDYGSLTYSFDGVTFYDLDAVFVGDNFGATVASGTYSADLSELFANQQFYLGFRWQNDPLVGTAFSFSIDDVRVNGMTRQIESDLNDSGEEYIGANETVYFYSANDGQLLAKVVNNTSHDFGCTSLSVERSGSDAESFFTGNSASKAIRFSPDFPTSNADVDITLYYSEAEISGFESATGEDREDLNLFNTTATNIDDASAPNTTESIAIYEDIKKTPSNVIAGSFTANVTGELGGLVVASESTAQSMIGWNGGNQNALANNNYQIGIFPNPATDKATISLQNIEFEQMVEISLRSINGQLLLAESFLVNSDRYFDLDLETINPGIYLVKIQTENEQISKKLIVE